MDAKQQILPIGQTEEGHVDDADENIGNFHFEEETETAVQFVGAVVDAAELSTPFDEMALQNAEILEFIARSQQSDLRGYQLEISRNDVGHYEVANGAGRPVDDCQGNYGPVRLFNCRKCVI